MGLSTEKILQGVIVLQIQQLMHLVGMAHDQNGTTFYLTKNSGGTDRKNEGYLYMSRAYVRLKTMAIMVHKDAIEPGIVAKFQPPN